MVYIVGTGRSGSTIVERIIGSVPGFLNVGELIGVFRSGVLLNERCGCGTTFHDCPFWTAVGAQAFGGWDRDFAAEMIHTRRSLIRQRFLPRLLSNGSVPRSPELHTYGAAYTALYAAFQKITGAEFIVDASKDAVHGIYVVRYSSADIRPLQLVRDPRGVAHSWTKRDMVRPNAIAKNRTMRTYSPAEIIRMWNRENLWGILMRLGRRSSLIDYEHFTQDPFRVLEAALNALGAEGSALRGLDRDRLELPQSHAIGGNPNRFQTGPIVVRVDDQWRDSMPPSQRAFVAAATSPVRGLLKLDCLLRTARSEDRHNNNA